MKRVSVSRFGRAAEIFGKVVDNIRKDVTEKYKEYEKRSAYQVALRGLAFLTLLLRLLICLLSFLFSRGSNRGRCVPLAADISALAG